MMTIITRGASGMGDKFAAHDARAIVIAEPREFPAHDARAIVIANVDRVVSVRFGMGMRFGMVSDRVVGCGSEIGLWV
uniref:Uncharacterized protein n=1 Tax=Quercus lobata TaxID=97700 RepID=A0A7N2LSQ0_QUELO